VQRVFKSRYHPKGRPPGLVYTQALVKPIGACMTPLMIGATAAVLQEERVWGYLVWGLPSALLIATLWTHFRLSSIAAEIHIRPGQVAVRSIQDVLLGRPIDWSPLHNVKASPDEVELSVGWTTHICRRADWTNYKTLGDAAQQAIQAQRHSSSPAP